MVAGFDLCIISESKGYQHSTKVWAADSTLLSWRSSTQKSSKAKALQVDTLMLHDYELTDQNFIHFSRGPIAVNQNSESIKTFFFPIRNKLCIIFEAPAQYCECQYISTLNFGKQMRNKSNTGINFNQVLVI